MKHHEENRQENCTRPNSTTVLARVLLLFCQGGMQPSEYIGLYMCPNIAEIAQLGER